MFVIKGNTAIFKCIVPSFVADYVSVVSWEDTIGSKYFVSHDENFGINVYYCRPYNMQSNIFNNKIFLFFSRPVFVKFIFIIENFIKNIVNFNYKLLYFSLCIVI